jgi:hypothetical protein
MRLYAMYNGSDTVRSSHGGIIEKERARPERPSVFNNASVVDNFIPVFFATLLKLAQWPRVDQLALKPRCKMVPKT